VETRRDFIRRTALTTTALAAVPASWLSAGEASAERKAEAPWYRRTLRWGQTNITEIDPTRYDVAWWRGPANEARRTKAAGDTVHTYLRLVPERRAHVDGPRTGSEPAVNGERHEVLRGFEETDLLPYGGVLEPLRVEAGAQVLATFVPAFPIYPPETAWMRVPKTDVPGLILNATVGGGRVAFLPADLDRRFSRDNLPDHGDLLANLVRWASRGDVPLVASIRRHLAMGGFLASHPNTRVPAEIMFPRAIPGGAARPPALSEADR